VTFSGSDILPSAATDLQRIIADYQWGRSQALDVEIVKRVVDPATCPEGLLDWLAFQKSVDTWSEDWPVERKRAVIAASPEVHRLKGTRKAVRLALEALGVPSAIKEWWEATPPARRATFLVTLDVTAGTAEVDLPFLQNARDQVRRAKPKSRAFDIALAATTSGEVFVAGCGELIISATLYPQA
jgi:phage tail P2-like protein